MVTSVTGTRPATALGPGDLLHKAPYRWAPTYTAALMGDRAWGNVAVYFDWDLVGSPSALRSFGDGTMNSIEVGWKATGWGECNTTDSINGSGGMPNGVYHGVDYTEDSGDAVAFIGDMATMATAHAAQPQVHWLWWTCHSEEGFNPADAYYNVQGGDGNRPYNSFAESLLNYFSHNAHVVTNFNGFPEDDAPDHMHEYQGFAPWLENGSFETGTTGWFIDGHDDTFATVVCATAPNPGVHSGRCYLRGTSDAGDGFNWLYASYSVENFTRDIDDDPDSLRSGLGLDTNLQYQGAFRCPATNPGPCQVDVWLKHDGASTWQANRDLARFQLPNDGLWRVALVDSFGGGTTGVATTGDLYLNLNGFDVDIDTQWIGSFL